MESFIHCHECNTTVEAINFDVDMNMCDDCKEKYDNDITTAIDEEEVIRNLEE